MTDFQKIHEKAWREFGPCVTWVGMTRGIRTDRWRVESLTWHRTFELAREAEKKVQR